MKESQIKRECCNTSQKSGLYHKRETGSVLGVNPLIILRNVLTEDADSFLYLVFYCHNRGMRQIKMREPVTLSPEISTQRCLVFNKKGEILPVFGIVNLTISSDESTEDAPHVSFQLRIRNLSHNNKALMLTELSAGALQYCNKKPRAQDSGISLWYRQGKLVVARTLPYTVMTLSNSLCKYTTKSIWRLFLLAEISNFDYKVTLI